MIGKEPATVEPEFLDSLVSTPDQTFPVKLGDKNTYDVAEGHRGRRSKVDLAASEHEEMNAKYKVTSEGGLAVSLVLCYHATACHDWTTR